MSRSDLSRDMPDLAASSKTSCWAAFLAAMTWTVSSRSLGATRTASRSLEASLASQRMHFGASSSALVEVGRSKVISFVNGKPSEVAAHLRGNGHSCDVQYSSVRVGHHPSYLFVIACLQI
jgi:hypothetical protein